MKTKLLSLLLVCLFIFSLSACDFLKAPSASDASTETTSVEAPPSENTSASDEEELPSENTSASDEEELPSESASVSDGEESPLETPVAWSYTVYELYAYDCIRGAHKVEFSFGYPDKTYQYPENTPKSLRISGRDVTAEYVGTYSSPYYSEARERYQTYVLNASGFRSSKELIDVGAESGRLLSYMNYAAIHYEDVKTQEECLAIAEDWLQAELSELEAYRLIDTDVTRDLQYVFTFSRAENGRSADAVSVRVSAEDDFFRYAVIDPKIADLKLLLSDEMLQDVWALITERIHAIYTADEHYGTNVLGDFTYEIPENFTVEETVTADGGYALKVRADVPVVLIDDEHPYWTDINEFYVVLTPME